MFPVIVMALIIIVQVSTTVTIEMALNCIVAFWGPNGMWESEWLTLLVFFFFNCEGRKAESIKREPCSLRTST